MGVDRPPTPHRRETWHRVGGAINSTQLVEKRWGTEAIPLQADLSDCQTNDLWRFSDVTPTAHRFLGPRRPVGWSSTDHPGRRSMEDRPSLRGGNLPRPRHQPATAL